MAKNGTVGPAAALLDPPWQLRQPATSLAKDSRTLGDLFRRQVARGGDAPAYYSKRNESWQPMSWRQVDAQCRAFASWLVAHGVEVGDKICIVGSTRVEWAVADIGGQLAGCVTLGAYPTLAPPQLAYVIDHSEAKVVVLENSDVLASVIAERSAMPKLKHIVIWDPPEGSALNVTAWSEILATPPEETRLTERQQAVVPSSTAVIVYTSGTTGHPKGAMISHQNVLDNLTDIEPWSAISTDDVTLSFLPMAHVAERFFGFYNRISTGMPNYFASSIPKVIDEVQQTRPTVFGGVPRIFEKAYAKMMSQVEQAPPTRRRIFRWAESIGRQVVKKWVNNEPVPMALRVQYRLADRLVFRKIRDVFGGRVRYVITGAAPIAYEILEFFWAAGLRIYEGYGMTEMTSVTHLNCQGQVRLGSVGRPSPRTEQRIADDGEVLLRGPLVFQGYFKNREATAQTIVDGWLHTGDIGEIDADGYLYIRDRKKHIIITAGGKNISPANIENEIKASDPLISQAHVHGDRRKYLVALVTLGPAEAVELAARRDMVTRAEADRILSELLANPLSRPDGLDALMGAVSELEDVRERVIVGVRRANESLSRVETVKKVFLLDRELSVSDDEMTPTFKVKRKNVDSKFEDVFTRLYEEDSFGLVVEV